MYPGIYNQSNLISPQQFATYAPEVDISAYTETAFSGIIAQATEWIYKHCEVPTVQYSTVTNEEHRGAIMPSGDLIIFPLVRPIQTITAVRLVKGGFSTTLNLFGVNTVTLEPQPFFQVPYPANKMVYPSSYLAGQGTLMIGGSQQLMSLRGAGVDAQIDYIGGWETNADGTTPRQSLIRACILVIRGMLVERYNQMGADSLRQGNVSVSFKNGEPIFYEQAAEILDHGGYHRTAPRI